MTARNEEVLNFGTETSKILKLMINSIYTDKDIFLRELISNAADAIEKRKYASIQDESVSAPDGDYKIIVSIDPKNQKISIKDNGIGMTKDEMIENLGTIAKSGTEDFIKNASGQKDLIGQFGVGFYSSFMVAEKVEVISKKAGSTEGHIWSSNGESSYSIQRYKDPCQEGTEVIISLKDSELVYLDKFKVKFILETYVTHTNIPIEIKSGEDIEKIKPKQPIWRLEKKDLTEDDYRSFYKSLSGLPDFPVIKIHYGAEGSVEFKTLLFIPSMCPYDLFHPDRNIKIKLYVKKVFITEENSVIMPKWLRFVYGVVESDDLPLNISRQTIQDNQIITKIRNSLTKKIFSEISSLRLQKRDEYEGFWKNFGNVLKEGLCEANNDSKDLILENALFYTNKSQEKPITLDEYISRAPKQDGKPTIYYCIADNIDNALSNPQLEKFNKNNIETLFLLDPVDSFWTNVVSSHKDIPFKSIAQADVHAEDAPSETEEEKEIDKDEMVRLISQALKDKVKSVVISKKLIESPACITVPSGSMDIAMEKFLLDQGQIKKGSLKIFEINHKNPLIQLAVSKLRDADKSEDGKELIQCLFEATCIAQGEQIKNPGLFAKRLASVLEKFSKQN